MPQTKDKSSKHYAERPGPSWREASLQGSVLVLSVVKDAVALAPMSELRHAASLALVILETIQAVKDNKEAYERLADDSGGLIVAIWRSYKKAENPEEWLSAEMREILEDLTHTLENIASFVKEKLLRRKTIRVIFSRIDAGKINEYRERLNYAMQKFELQSHMNINDVLTQLVKKNDQLSEQILHLNDKEDSRPTSEMSAQEAKDREIAQKMYEEELKRVHEEEAMRKLEIAARDAKDRELAEKAREEELKKVHEEETKKMREIAELERLKQIEIDRQARDKQFESELKRIDKETKDRQAELEHLRSAATTMAEANRLKKVQEDEIAELKRRVETEERRNKTGSSKKKKNSNSRRRDEVEEEDSFEDDSTDDYSDEEDYAPPPVKSPKTKRMRDSPSGTPPRDVDNWLGHHLQGLGLGNPYGSRSNSPLGLPIYSPNTQPTPYFPTYGGSFSPPMMPYGYGGGGGSGVIINSGVGNTTTTNISNVGNDNSKKIYRTSTHNQRRATGR